MENRNGQGIFYGVIGVATLVVAIIGATFAWFAAGNTNTGTVAGETASAGIGLSVTKKAGGTGKLVPQLAQTLDDALTGKSASCIDDNGNTVCQVYEIVVTNSGTSAVSVDTDITLTPTNIEHLKWVKLATVNTLTSALSADGGNTPSTTKIASAENLAANGTTTYWIAVWVEEKGSDQTSEDTGSFTGTVTVTTAGGQGVTSTFTA